MVGRHGVHGRHVRSRVVVVASHEAERVQTRHLSMVERSVLVLALHPSPVTLIIVRVSTNVVSGHNISVVEHYE